MIIGIDIDDTLTNIHDKLIDASFDYAKQLGKEVNVNKSHVDDSKNDGNIYQQMFGFTYAELKYFLREIQESITETAKPRKDVRKVLEDLHKDGHKIVIVTARDYEFHEDPYAQSIKWLKDNKIYYDKIIANARNKYMVCDALDIDVFIDDGLSNCLNVSKLGIPTIRICDEEKTKSVPSQIIYLKNWKDIYKFIKQLGN